MCVVPSLLTVVFCTRVACVCLVCLQLCKEEGSSPVSLQLLRGRLWTCMKCPVYIFVGFWNGDYVSQLPYVWYYVVVKSSFQHSRDECEPKKVYVFRCLMLSLLGPCKLLFLLCVIASWT